MNTPTIRTNEALLQWIASGGNPKYLFFWGHRARRDGTISKSVFSQWWPAEFTVDGITYQTAEHFMMAGKARLFGDERIAREIAATSNPGEAKKLGRMVKGFDEKRWTEARFDIVVRGNLAKFDQNRELGEFLLGTGDRVLVEASPADRIWGIGLAEDDPRSADPRTWQGLNLLGFALMEARKQLGGS